MGCICSKGADQEDQSEVHRDKSSTKSSRRHVASSRKDQVTVADADTPKGNDTARLLTKSQENVVTPPPLSVYNGKDKVQANAIVNAPPLQTLIAHHRRATVDIGAGEAEFVLKINHIPNALEAEHVAAGWPSWLASVAREAIKGWVPRRADTFEKLDKIGQGTYSNVYKARDLETGKIVALKKVRFVNMDPESVRFMAREINILRKLDHPNIVKLEGLITSKMSSSLYLVFEYMEHDLAGLAATPGIKFTEPQVKCYMQQLLNGLDHCHSRGILHRDIKGSNLLIDNKGILKIADFGLATNFNPDLNQPLTSRVVTLWYRPPELLLGATEYGVAVDLWSTGCILAELLAGKPIMPGRTEVEQMHKIFKLCGSPSEDYWRKSKLPHATLFKPQHPYRRCVRETFKDFPSPALNLLDVLLVIKPEERGTAASALNSAFFTTKPYACDPSSLPKYPPSKEFDAKLRDEEARRQRAAAAKELGSEHTRNASRETRRMTGAVLQKTNTQLNTKGETDRLEHGRSEFTNHPNGTTKNHISHSGSFLHPGAVAPSLTMKVKDNSVIATTSRSSSTAVGFNGPEFKTHRSFMPHSGVGDLNILPGLVAARTTAKSDNHREKSKQKTHWPEHRLDVAEATEIQEWTNQIFDVPSSSHRKDGRRISAKEPTMGYSGKKNRMHYSGPLMPPGGNIEEMLREHERQIQQAVRKARLDKAKTKKNYTEQ